MRQSQRIQIQSELESGTETQGFRWRDRVLLLT